jgi:hypothetical protein
VEAAVASFSRDRFGFTWRPELAAGLLVHLDRIDVIEVIADDYLEAPTRAVRALETLAVQVPIVLHGVSLGPASTVPVEPRRLARMAKLNDRVQPAFWSEHLAFVRGGGVEIGHLAAPPRTWATIESTAANLRRAREVVGAPPLVENIATLIDPPASTLSEAEWVSAVVGQSGCDMLLDLHNLHANSVNFDFDPIAYLDCLDPERIGAIHLAGGRWIDAPILDGETAASRRWLDDHLHDVPNAVYALLREVGARVKRPLTVIIERDGAFPPIEHLLCQLDHAREALAEGRSRVCTGTSGIPSAI